DDRVAVRLRVGRDGGRRRGRLRRARRHVPVSDRGARAVRRLSRMNVEHERRRPREAPRVRDMPAPRKSEGAAGGAAQHIFAWTYRAVLAFLLWTGVSPNQLTLLSLAANVGSGVLIVAGQWAWAGVALILGGTFDVMDGSVARHRGESRRSGAFMDSVLDRVSDMILFSCLFWRLAGDGQTTAAVLALLTLVVS